MDALNEAKDRWNGRRENHEFEELSLVTREGLRLAGYYWSSSKTTEKGQYEKTVILVHGMMDSGAGMGYLAEEYHERYWNVLCIDLRAHGESGGTKMTMGYREADDIALWVDLISVNYPSSSVFLHGVSMGGAAVLMYCGLSSRLPPCVKGVISDSSYASYTETFIRLLYLVVKNQFVSLSIVQGTSLVSWLLSGVRFGLMSPIKMINRITVPILFFHGQKDVLIPPGMVQKMMEKASALGAESVIIPEAPHIGAYFYARELYMQRIDDFYRRNK